jgi:membrane-associated phospholipid phosphatase
MRTGARLPLLAGMACAIAFVALLAFAYSVGATARLDATALHGLAALRGPWADPVAHLFTRLADPLPLVVMLGGVFACGWALGRRRQAVAAVALVAVANVTTQILKVALAHPRVQPALGGDPLGPEAFPSGHATAAMSIALAAVLVAPARWRVAVAAAATVYVIGVCTSLLVLAWHFPSDVVGGLLVASGFFFCAVAAIRAAAGAYTAAARERLRLAASPRLGEAALVLASGVGVFALLRAQDLVSFARLHTAATATALAIMATSAGLLATAALIADDRP